MHLLIFKQLLVFPETQGLLSSENPGQGHTGKASASGRRPGGFWAGDDEAKEAGGQGSAAWGCRQSRRRHREVAGGGGTGVGPPSDTRLGFYSHQSSW